MTQRRKLELQLNTPTEIALLFDEPIVGKSQYGDFAMYAVRTQEAEFSFFAPPEIHEQLQHKRKGDRAVIQKIAVQKQNKVVTSYKVDFPDAPAESELPKEQVAPSTGDSSAESDNYYNIMLKSYQDSFKLQEELGGMIDIEKCAICIFIARSKLPIKV